MSIYETPAATVQERGASTNDDRHDQHALPPPEVAALEQDTGAGCAADIIIPDYDALPTAIDDAGTGGLRQSSRVMASSASSSAAGVKPLHVLGDVLLVPEAVPPTSDASILSTRITAFKEARAQRKQRFS
jgi:hypothetical protein